MISKILEIYKLILKFISPVIIILKSIGALFSAGGNSSINEGLYKGLGILSSVLDIIAPVLGDEDTKKISDAITEDEVSFKGVTASIVKDKHGEGNHGIKIGYTDGKTTITYDPTDGSVDGSIKIEL
jgi:hypothetical protein